ncbi:protein ANTAGONIST OF LIKE HETEROCHROMATIN PROTEIN 1-like [Cyprinus carpio]|uniref:Protein ANTAGONIST OF LIKE HETEROCHROMATIN PROTEIN 1-like n=1 Tax=Cyprinus carpio TaxID=7962 RepID=A0A9Q9W2P8_CYPCA|nr:protein ANTAGONIST OF LIKE HETEROCHROMATIN PROTEIN 1-like [Cyprinus carpio]
MEEIAFAFFIADEVDAIEIPLLLHEDGYDEENHRRNVPKIPHFVENVVHLYSPSEFQSHFRLSRGHVEVCRQTKHHVRHMLSPSPMKIHVSMFLLYDNYFFFLFLMQDLINTLDPFYMNKQQTKVHLTNSILASLWTLSNQESYRGVADRFNITKSTVSTHLHEFCSLVITHLSHYISWPRGQALHISQLEFETAGFPKTVCAVDGCHIPIVKPHCENPVAYINRKQFYSVILTGFCDSQRRFCHVSVGHPGSWHDSRAFRLSEVGRLLKEDPHSLVPEGMHIIGDSAYPLSLQLMKPYRDNGHLTVRQRRFNRKLNSARVVIEHAFGILKSKFRRLRCLHMKKVKNISSAVTACCILHNICLKSSDQIEEDQQADVMEDDPYPPEAHIHNDASHRDAICGRL